MSSGNFDERFSRSYNSGRSLRNNPEALSAASPKDKDEDSANKFSSSSSSFTSVVSAKYKSIDKMSRKKEFTTSFNGDNDIKRDDSPPPLPPTAAPPLHNTVRVRDEEENNEGEEKAKNSVNTDATPACFSEEAPSQATSKYLSNANGSEQETSRSSRIDLANANSAIGDANDASDGQERGRCVEQPRSRRGSSTAANRIVPVSANTVAPYITPPPLLREFPYTTFQRHPPYQIRTEVPMVYATEAGEKIPNAFCKVQMFQFLEVAIKRILFHLAKAATHHQFVFMLLPLLLTILPFAALWFIRAELSLETPPFDAFLPYAKSYNDNDLSNYYYYFHQRPSSADAITASVLATANFNGSNPMFDAPRRTSPYEFSVILSTRSRFGNILANSSLNAYKELFAKIRNISVVHSLVRLEWRDMCREECGEDDRRLINAIQNRQLLLKYPEAVVLKTVDSVAKTKSGGNSALPNFHNMNRVFLANVLGDVELDLDGIVSRARSLLLNIKLKETLKPHTLFAFEHKLRQILKNFTLTGDEAADVELNFWSFRGYVDEVLLAMKHVHLRLIFSCAIFTIFAFVVMGFSHCNVYKCRPFVAIQIVFIIAFAALLSYAVHVLGARGALNYTLFPALFIFGALAILLFAIKAQCFSRYSLAALHPAEKLAFIYSWDMPGFVGATVALAAACAGTAWLVENALIRQMLLLMATGLATILLFGTLYLTAFWYAAEKREASGLKWFQICKIGDESFNNKYVFDYDELICDRLHEKLADLRPSVSRWFGQVAALNHARTLCAVAYTAFLIFAGVNFFTGEHRQAQLREEYFVSNETNGWPWSSAGYLRRFDTAYEKYADYLELIFELPVDYYNKRNKERIFEMLRWPLDNQYATRVVSWLMDFERFQKSTIFDVNPDTIVPVVDYVFLKSDPYRKYTTDIVFDRFQTQILKSRMYLELNSKGVASSNLLIKELERRAKEANLPVVFNAPYAFLLRHDRQVFQLALSAFVWLTVFLTLASVVLFTHAVVWICVPLSGALVTVGVCGILPSVLVPFNIVTLSTVLIGNLFTAAVTLCFCYAFNNAGLLQNTNAKRMKYAFQCTLWPTVLACLAPILFYAPLLLGVVPPIVIHVWKVLTVISMVTLLNYLFFLPSVTIIFTDYVASCVASVNNFCDGNGCCVLEQPAESIYFVPHRAVLPSIHAARSIASFYNAPNYIANDTLMLPPAYDYRQQRMIMAAASPPLLPPPLPVGAPPSIASGGNNASNSGGRRSLCSQVGGSSALRDLNAEQLSSSYPHEYRGSPQSNQHHYYSSRHNHHHHHQDAQSPRSPRTPRQRLANSNSPHRNHRCVIQEATDNSNCDSLDSQSPHASSRRLVNNGVRNYADSPNVAVARLRRDFSASASTSKTNSPRVAANKVHAEMKRRPTNITARPNAAVGGSTARENEQIYEEPESPVVLRARRSQSDGRRRNAAFDASGGGAGGGSSVDASLGSKSAFSPHILRREIAEQMAASSANNNSAGIVGERLRKENGMPSKVAASSGVMHPNWRQYLLEGNVSAASGTADGNPMDRLNAIDSRGSYLKQPRYHQQETPYTVSSPSSNRRRYHF